MKRKLPDMFNRDVYLIENLQKLKLESDAKGIHHKLVNLCKGIIP